MPAVVRKYGQGITQTAKVPKLCKNQCSWEEKTRKIQRSGVKGSLSLVLCPVQARATLLIPLGDPNFNRLQRQNHSKTAQICLPKRGQEIPTSQHTIMRCARTPSTEQGGNQSGDHANLLCEQEISAKLIYQTRRGAHCLIHDQEVMLHRPLNFQCIHL